MLLLLLAAAAAQNADAGAIAISPSEGGGRKAATITVKTPSPEDPPGVRKLDDGNYRLGRARMTVPVRAGRWRLKEIKGNSFDAVLSYRAAEGTGVITLFLTRPARADERLLWKTASTAFQGQAGAPEAATLLSTPAGDFRLLQRTGTADDGAEVAELLAHGVTADGWIVKLRLTARGASRAEAQGDAGAVLGALQLAPDAKLRATDAGAIPPCEPAVEPGKLPARTKKQRDDALTAGILLAAMVKMEESGGGNRIDVQPRCELGHFTGSFPVLMTRRTTSPPDYLGAIGDSGAALVSMQLPVTPDLHWAAALPAATLLLTQTRGKPDDRTALAVAAAAEAAVNEPLVIVQLE